MPDVDERIRTVLDLGDSSGAVKALDREIEKLLEDFKKQTELFEQKKMAPQAYAEALSKMKSEASALSGAMKELGGGGGGADLEGVNRKLFALERGMTSLISGTGLGRAAGLLESGLALFGGPAGLGVTAALIANTIDNVAPKIKSAWDRLFTQFGTEDVQAKLLELEQQRKALVDGVKQIWQRPIPGTEALEEERQKMLSRLLNVGTLTGPKSIREGMIRAILGNQGATTRDITPEEKQQIKELMKTIDPARALKEAWEEQGSTGWLIKSFEVANQPMFGPGLERAKVEADKQIKAIWRSVAERTMGRLLAEAQQPGETGRIALEAIKNLAMRFPELFAQGDLATQVDKILKLMEEERKISGVGAVGGQAAAAVRYPTATDRQRELEMEQLEQGRIGSRAAREQREQQMFGKNLEQQMLEQFPGLKLSDPRHRQLMQEQEQAAWRLQWGIGRRSQLERMERETAERSRTAEMLGEHPEMTFEEVQTQARAETARRERAIYPERFRRPRPRRRLQPEGRQVRGGVHPGPPVVAPESPQQKKSLIAREARRRAMENLRFGPPTSTDAVLIGIQQQIDHKIRERSYKATVKPYQSVPRPARAPKPDKWLTDRRTPMGQMTELDILESQREKLIQEINDMKVVQQHMLKAWKTGTRSAQVGAGNYEKMLAGWRTIQSEIDQKILPRLQHIDRNAANLLREQQRTQQNVTGHP